MCSLKKNCFSRMIWAREDRKEKVEAAIFGAFFQKSACERGKGRSSRYTAGGKYSVKGGAPVCVWVKGTVSCLEYNERIFSEWHVHSRNASCVDVCVSVCLCDRLDVGVREHLVSCFTQQAFFLFLVRTTWAFGRMPTLFVLCFQWCLTNQSILIHDHIDSGN